MFERVRDRVRRAYLRELKANIGNAPEHVAVIQDGNRRYAREQGLDATDGHVEGANTTEEVLRWCEEIGVRELTLYAFSTENFERPDDELTSLFELIADRLHNFADADLVHEKEVHIRGLGDISQLPEHVVEALEYAERRTETYDTLTLNIALAYGGRNELLRSARRIARDVKDGAIDPDDVSVAEIEKRLYREPIRDVDLILRTGGDERTSNFLPWHASGSEAAVYFCTPYWPEFGKVDFFRAIRTYESREESWQRTRTERAVTLVRSLAEVEYTEQRKIVSRLRERLSPSGADEFSQRIDPVEIEPAQSRDTSDD